MSIPKFIVWFKTKDQQFRILNNDNTFVTSERLPQNINQFELNDKSLSATDVDLKIYKSRLIEWRNELLNCKCLKVKYDYFDNSFKNSDGTIFFKRHSNNVLTFLKRFLRDDY